MQNGSASVAAGRPIAAEAQRSRIWGSHSLGEYDLGSWGADDEDDMLRMIDELERRLRVVLFAALLLVGCGDDGAHQDSAPTMDAASFDTSLDAAERYLAGDNPTQAAAIAVRLTNDAPGRYGPHDLLGRIALRRAVQLRSAGRESEAIEVFVEAYGHYALAVECAPGLSGLQQSAGEIAHHAEMPAVAMSHYLAASALDPENPKPPLYIAQLMVADGDPEGARHWIETVLQIDPSQQHALATLSVIEMESDRWSQAFEAIARARAANPHAVEIRVVEARLHRRNGNSNRALELLSSLSDAEQAHETVTSELAMNWTLIGRPEQAAAAWIHCLGAQSQPAAAGRMAINAAEAWIAAGSMDEASLWLDQAEQFGGSPARIEAIRLSLSAVEDQD